MIAEHIRLYQKLMNRAACDQPKNTDDADQISERPEISAILFMKIEKLIGIQRNSSTIAFQCG